MIRQQHIPSELRTRPQWVLWKTVQRDKPTKVPFGIDGNPAKSNDPSTWASFDDVMAVYDRGGYDGIGYEFCKDDPFVGIDLDGCRDPETGELAQWAREIVLEFGTYTEVSPSFTGVKLFIVGKSPFTNGRKIELKNQPTMCDKAPAVEVYEHGRYFAVTGLKLKNGATSPQSCGIHLAMLCERLWPAKAVTVPAAASVNERARRYLSKLPPAISGSGGHNATFRAACILMLGFELERDEALSLLLEWNQTCQPPWEKHELEHKINDAAKQPGERGYLRDATPQQWATIMVPHYEWKEPRKPKPFTTMADAARKYVERVRAGKTNLIHTRLPELDAAIGGGVEAGEMIVIAARPSHGKSAVAMQITHNLSADNLPVLIITEEMSEQALGKRALLFASEVPQESWWRELPELERDLRTFVGERTDCYIVENCGTTEVVVAEIERFVREKGVQAVIVDYVQLLGSPGNGRYEKVTNTSIALRRVASEQKIALFVLAQLNREIESRPKFEPKMSDLKETGQLEQDADVVIFLVWPHRIDASRDPNNYKFYVAKNRNREIAKPVFEVRFEPSRQMLVDRTVKDLDNYEPAFETYDPAWK